MYKIVGADRKTYGPVPAEQIKQWINEGRANASTLVQAEGSADWKPLFAFAEFAAESGSGASSTASPPPRLDGTQLAAEVLPHDYQLEIGSCFGRGWNLFKENFGLFFGATIVFLVIQTALAALGAIPIAGLIFSVANLFLVGPLSAGLFMIMLHRLRGQPAEVADLFSGFGHRYLHLMLAYLVPTLLTGAAMAPGIFLTAIAIFVIGIHSFGLGLVVLPVGILLVLLPAIYCGVSWLFAVILTMDQQLDFWRAMELSRTMVGKHFFRVFLFLLLTAVVNFIGMMACGFGFLFTLPISMAALMQAYETMFRGRQTA